MTIRPDSRKCRQILRTALIVAILALLLGLLKQWWVLVWMASNATLFSIITIFAPGFMIRNVRVYENGLERNLARTWSRRAFLPWSGITGYQFDGNILRISWMGEPFLAFRGSQTESAEPLKDVRPGIKYDFYRPTFYWGFPEALELKPEQVPTLKALLERAPVARPTTALLR